MDVADQLKIPAVLIGGLALPAYNVARTTLDIDICIYVKSREELNRFIEVLYNNDISTVQNPNLNHDLFTVFGKRDQAEIWLKSCDPFIGMIKWWKRYGNFLLMFTY